MHQLTRERAWLLAALLLGREVEPAGWAASACVQAIPRSPTDRTMVMSIRTSSLEASERRAAMFVFATASCVRAAVHRTEQALRVDARVWRAANESGRVVVSRQKEAAGAGAAAAALPLWKTS